MTAFDYVLAAATERAALLAEAEHEEDAHRIGEIHERLNAIDAAEHGATVVTRCACIDAERSGAQWQATLRSDDGTTHRVQARALVNAAGPWAAQFLAEHAHAPRRARQ